MREFAFNPFNLFNLFIKKFILFLLPYFLLLHLLNTSSTSTVTSVYSNSDSDYLKKTNNNKFKKSYFKYDDKSINDTIYVEIIYKDNTTNLINSNILFSISWFLNKEVIFDKDQGFFYGISQTNYINKRMFSDVILCRVKSVNLLYRCDDYYVLHENTENDIESNFINFFDPILDYKEQNGEDNILFYNSNDIIKENIYPYKSLIKFSIALPLYSSNKLQDLDFDFNNNLTIFYGNITTTDNHDSKLKYNILSIVSKNYSDIYKTVAQFHLSIDYLIILTFLLINFV